MYTAYFSLYYNSNSSKCQDYAIVKVHIVNIQVDLISDKDREKNILCLLKRTKVSLFGVEFD